MSKKEQVLDLILDGYEVAKEDRRILKWDNEFLIQGPDGGCIKYSSPTRAVQDFLEVSLQNV